MLTAMSNHTPPRICADSTVRLDRDIIKLRNLIPRPTDDLIQDSLEKDRQIEELQQLAETNQENLRGLESDIVALKDKHAEELERLYTQLREARQEKKEVMMQELDGDAASESTQQVHPEPGKKKRRRRKKAASKNKTSINDADDDAEESDIAEDVEMTKRPLKNQGIFSHSEAESEVKLGDITEEHDQPALPEPPIAPQFGYLTATRGTQHEYATETRGTQHEYVTESRGTQYEPEFSTATDLGYVPQNPWHSDPTRAPN